MVEYNVLMRTRVVGYVRVSTEQQADEGVSLAAQRAKLEAYAIAMDLDLVCIEADEGISAKSLKRPGLQRALSCLGKTADGLLIVKLDRLTRRVMDLGALLEQYFVIHSLLSVGDSIDTRTANGRMLLNILTSVAEWERDAGSERTKAALVQVKAEGGRIGSVPLGKRRSVARDASGRRIVEDDPAGLAVIERIRTWRIEGTSIRGITARLNARGDKRWHSSQVRRVLA